MVFVYKSYMVNDLGTLNKAEISLLLIVMAVVSLLLSHAINWKYLSDIRNGVKRVETRVIQKKQSKVDFEAGSGTLYIGQEMKKRTRCNIIVNNIPYRVDKNFFLNCNESDEVLFNFAPCSDYLINVEL